jgi:hypothetical protein
MLTFRTNRRPKKIRMKIPNSEWDLASGSKVARHCWSARSVQAKRILYDATSLV